MDLLNYCGTSAGTIADEHNECIERMDDCNCNCPTIGLLRDKTNVQQFVPPICHSTIANLDDYPSTRSHTHHLHGTHILIGLRIHWAWVKG